MRLSGSEDRVDDLPDGLSQMVFVDKAPAHVEQIFVAEAGFSHTHSFQPGVGAESIKTKQQARLQ